MVGASRILRGIVRGRNTDNSNEDPKKAEIKGQTHAEKTRGFSMSDDSLGNTRGLLWP